MFERFMTYAKAHPWLVAGMVAVGVLIIWYFGSSSSSSSSSGTQAGIYAETQDPNVVAANAALAANQMNTNAAVSQANISAQTSQTEQAAQIQGALSLAQIQAGALANNNSTTLALAGIQQQVVNDQTDAAKALGMASIDAQESTYNYTLNASTQTLQQALGDAYANKTPLIVNSSPLGSFAVGGRTPAAQITVQAQPNASAPTTAAAVTPTEGLFSFPLTATTSALSTGTSAADAAANYVNLQNASLLAQGGGFGGSSQIQAQNLANYATLIGAA